MTLMPRNVQATRGVLLVGAVLALAAAPAPEAAGQGFFSWFSPAEPGTPEWWKSNKKKAVFEPGKGYSVSGVEGYFDEAGRPINASVEEVFESFAGEDDKVGLLPGLDPRVSYRKAREAAGYGPNEQVARDALAEAEQLLKQGEYSKAADACERALDRLPGSTIAHRAQFLLGECYFWQDKYVAARDAYDKLVSEQPNTRDLDTLIERQWEIARYWESHHFDYKPEPSLRPNFFDKTRPRLDTVGHAIKTYESIRLNDPTGPRADDAIMKTAGIYFRRGQFADADYHYTLLRTEYPRSEHQFDAHILGLQSKLRKYLGPDYDGTSLKEATALLKKIRTQFAGRLTDEEKDRLKQAQAEVQLAIETRELRMAEYYDNTEQYGAARQIYHRIARERSGSPVGERAAARLAELGGKPDDPPTRMAWFVDLFPENRERSRVAGITEIAPTQGGTRLANEQQQEGGVRPASATTTR